MQGESIEFNSLLVPVDFSPASEAAFQCALKLAVGEKSNVIVLHVIDTALIDFVSAHGWGSREEVVAVVRQQAENKLKAYHQPASERLEIDTLATEGIPFLEIIRKAKDFAVDAIIIGKSGAGYKAEHLLFGSTAEKVLRASRQPVIVFPFDGSKEPLPNETL